MITNTYTAVRKSMTIAEVAEKLGKSQQFVRIGLQRGILTFGTAQIMPNKNKYTYYISPALFFQYIGKPLPEEYKEKEETTTGRYTVITEPISKISWRG